MSKNQLYNKYRPHCFLDVIGQQFVVKTLVNAIKTNHLAHAYIFCGPRGIGKTSIARIFAKAINCLNPKNGDCCNQCDHCKIFENNHNIDVIEVDAASTGGVKEVEEITKNLYLSPTQLKYKVVIFDEAHMMSKEAWNSLLKIIEEPPAHCVFIFATTEYYKILPTIISRCQFLQFNRFNHNELQKTLDLVIKQEKISIDQKSIVKIIQLANGAARDALTILEQLCSLTNNQITSDDINNAFGIIDNSEKNAFIKLLFTNNCEAALKKIDVFIQNGINIGQFIKDIIGIFIDLLTYQKTKSLEFSNNTNLQELIDSLDNTDFNKITYLIDVWQEQYDKIISSNEPFIYFQIAILKSCSDNDKVTKQEVMNSISKKQEKTSSNVTNNNQENASEIIIEIPKSKKTLEQINNKKVMDNVSNNNDDVEKLYYFIIKNHSPFQLEDAKKKWSKLLIDVKAKMFSEFSFLIQAKQILFASENAMIVVYTRLMDVFEHNNNCFRTSFIQLIKPYFGTNFFIIGMDFISAQEYAKKYRQKDLDFTKINDFSLTQIKIID